MSKKSPWKSGVLIVVGLLVLYALRSPSSATSSPESPDGPSPNNRPKSQGHSKALNVVANLVALVLTSLATVTVAIQQAEASEVESVSAVGGYLVAAVSGPFIVNIDCEAFVAVDHRHRWDCAAGIEWDNGRKWRKEYPTLDMPTELPAAFAVYAVNSRASVLLLPTKDFGPNPPPGLVRTEGTGELGPKGTEARVVGYTAVGLSVGDAKQCRGYVISDQELEESGGLPLPNSCLLRFTVSMPADSVARNSGTFAFNSIEFNPRSARIANDHASVMAALDILPEVDGREDPTRHFHYSEYLIGAQRLYVHLSEVPPGWAPTFLNPRPVEGSPAIDRPEWEYLGSSPSSFYISASGSVPVHQTETVRVFLLGALIGVLGSLVASSVLAVLQVFDRH